MNAILIWVVFPLIIGGLLFLFQSKRRLITLIGLGIAISLASLAWAFPVGKVFMLGSWNFEITGQFSVYGRQIILTQGDWPILTLLYLMIAFWFLGSLATNVPSTFVPLGMVGAAMIVVGISIEPSFYAALVFEFVALLFVILLSVPGRPLSKGVLRFLTLQTLGMLFILFAGWSFSQVDVNVIDTAILARPLVMMGLGFSLLLGIFPFSTWFPMLAGKNDPYLTAFVFNLFLNGGMLFGLDFLEKYAWVNEYIDILGAIQVVGAIMLGVGGVWAVFQRNLGRMLGYAMVAEIGCALLAYSLGVQGLSMYFALLIIQVFALAIWALALHLLYTQTQDLDYHAVAGIARHFPLLAAGILLAHFSLAGLPLLAGFPLQWALGSQLAQLDSYGIALWLLLGRIGLASGGVRTLGVLFARSEEMPEKAPLKYLPKVLLILGGLALIIFGFSPHYLIHVGEYLSLALQ